MKAFAQLFADLDQTNKPNDKVALLQSYLAQSSDPDKTWGLALLTGQRPKRLLTLKLLKSWAIEASFLDEWIFEASYDMVGDLAETIALVLPPPAKPNSQPLSDWIASITDKQGQTNEQKKAFVLNAWQQLNSDERLVFNKLITGGFRTELSQKLIVEALSGHTAIDKAILAQRLTSNWQAPQTSFEELFLATGQSESGAQPYPFLVSQMLESPEALGNVDDWQTEWYWDGIRAQLIADDSKIYLWSEDQELLTDKFPELHPLKDLLPDGTILDGMIMAYKDNKPQPVSTLQSRMGRKNLTKKLLQTIPVRFMAFDMLEYEKADCRQLPLYQRRELLEQIIAAGTSNLSLSPKLDAKDWSSLNTQRLMARSMRAKGLILKNSNSPYQSDADSPVWYSWKTDALRISGVLMYVQKGQDANSVSFTQYTFGLWHHDELISFTKVRSGLGDDEEKEINEFVKENTIERFGPVRTVKPQLVFELAFEDIQESARHKSGITLNAPRILHWNKDQKPEEANTLEELKDLLKLYG